MDDKCKSLHKTLLTFQGCQWGSHTRTARERALKHILKNENAFAVFPADTMIYLLLEMIDADHQGLTNISDLVHIQISPGPP